VTPTSRKRTKLVDATVQAIAARRARCNVDLRQQLVERIQRGMKVAFATSIAHMLERALWIVGLAVDDRVSSSLKYRCARVRRLRPQQPSRSYFFRLVSSICDCCASSELSRRRGALPKDRSQ
jgi:hypothetical protein